MESATASYWTELSKACAEVGSALDVRPGFVRELDLNGDGVPDAILSTEHGSCATAPSMFAGTAGEAARWLVSRPGGFETLDFMYQKVEIDEATKPPRVTMFLHGMACGKVGADRCRHVFRIEGAKVVTVSWPDGQASPAKSGKDETTQDADDPMPVVRAGHNGSTVELIGDRIVYLSPKAALRDVVKAGTVIFDGKWIGKGFVGTAYAFKKGCPPAPYPVKGAYAGRPGQLDIVLLGDGPIRQGCEVVGYSDRSPHSRLVFDRIMSN